MNVIARNKQASHLYFLEDRFEAGIVLRGTEIKSIREGKVSIKDAHVRVKNDEAFIINMHVAKYKQANQFNHDETRTRKLLMHKREIVKLGSKIQRENYTLVPTMIYIDKGICKIEIALAKGKKLHDKRQSIKEKDVKRRMEKNMKQHV